MAMLAMVPMMLMTVVMLATMVVMLAAMVPMMVMTMVMLAMMVVMLAMMVVLEAAGSIAGIVTPIRLHSISAKMATDDYGNGYDGYNV